MIAVGVDTPLILGVMEIGVFLSLVMFGVIALQGYVYFRNCHSDQAGMKLLVGSVLIFELCHSIASCHAIYYFTVILAGVPEFEKPANSYSVSLLPVFETLITALVQGFFAYRIRLLSGRICFSLICWALCLKLCPLCRRDGSSGRGLPRHSLGAGLFPSPGHVRLADHLLIRQLYTPSPYNLPRSDQLIHRLIVWTIQTGLITSLTSVAVVIAFQIMKRNFIWLALYTFLAKLYSNSLLVSLNSRPEHRAIVRPQSPKSWDAAPSRPRTPNLTIQITRTTEDDTHTLIGESFPDKLQVPEKVVYNKGAYRLA
ncbi:hypothetical protein C8R47DRAFT_710783 [Mycena vitilis]|nr:hypothetical protein C8R47DRAFT_710783 [Mycena vitilis]